MIIKAVIVIGIALMLGMSSRSAIIVGLALSQVGEFSFILSKTGLSAGLLDQNIYQLFLAVAILTMAMTPFIINVAPRLAERMAYWPFLKIFRQGSYRPLAAANGFSKLGDHLVIIGFGINGRNIAQAAKLASIPYVIVEMNPDTVRTMRTEGEPITYGDATGRETMHQVAIEKARIAVIAISDPVGTRRIAKVIRELNPNLYIIVRTRFVSEMQALYDLGADEVIPEEFETSVEIFTRVLLKYLVPRNDIEKFIGNIRSDSYQMFRGLSRRTSTLKDLQSHMPGIEINALRLNRKSPIAGQTIAQAQIRKRFGINILAIVREGNLIANPESSQELLAGDILYIIGSRECCNDANRDLSLAE
jgi:CPA2 family monovalent cation:H+ antiporter-2